MVSENCIRDAKGFILSVLILVLVEDGLGVNKINKLVEDIEVLILVLVEDGLGGIKKKGDGSLQGRGLNPCFSGGWSRSARRQKL